jgi:predicted GNAT family N-acyltransferase
MPSDDASRRYAVERVTWADARESLACVRRAVFIEEQGVPEALEWDADDASAVHALASDAEGVPIGTARLLRTGRIGRMAVLPAWRRRGVGTAMLRLLIGTAREGGLPRLVLHAQVHAMPFYERHGFVARGEEFSEAGIPHREMVLIPQVPSAGARA